MESNNASGADRVCNHRASKATADRKSVPTFPTHPEALERAVVVFREKTFGLSHGEVTAYFIHGRLVRITRLESEIIGANDAKPITDLELIG